MENEGNVLKRAATIFSDGNYVCKDIGTGSISSA